MTIRPAGPPKPLLSRDYISEFADFATNVSYAFERTQSKKRQVRDRMDEFGHSVASALFVATHLEKMKNKFPNEPLEQLISKCIEEYRSSNNLND